MFVNMFAVFVACMLFSAVSTSSNITTESPVETNATSTMSAMTSTTSVSNGTSTTSVGNGTTTTSVGNGTTTSGGNGTTTTGGSTTTATMSSTSTSTTISTGSGAKQKSIIMPISIIGSLFISLFIGHI